MKRLVVLGIILTGLVVLGGCIAEPLTDTEEVANESDDLEETNESTPNESNSTDELESNSPSNSSDSNGTSVGNATDNESENTGNYSVNDSASEADSTNDTTSEPNEFNETETAETEETDNESTPTETETEAETPTETEKDTPTETETEEEELETQEEPVEETETSTETEQETTETETETEEVTETETETETESEPESRIGVVVVDSETGDPIGGAHVKITDHSPDQNTEDFVGSTGVEGAVGAERPTGVYSVEVGPEGYYSASTVVEHDGTNESIVRVPVDPIDDGPEEEKLVVTVVDERGNALSGARVSAVGTSEEFDKTTNSSGIVSMRAPEDTYLITLDSEGYAEDKVQVNHGSDDRTDIRVELRPEEEMSDAQGATVGGPDGNESNESE